MFYCVAPKSRTRCQFLFLMNKHSTNSVHRSLQRKPGNHTQKKVYGDSCSRSVHQRLCAWRENCSTRGTQMPVDGCSCHPWPLALCTVRVVALKTSGSVQLRSYQTAVSGDLWKPSDFPLTQDQPSPTTMACPSQWGTVIDQGGFHRKILMKGRNVKVVRIRMGLLVST